MFYMDRGWMGLLGDKYLMLLFGLHDCISCYVDELAQSMGRVRQRRLLACLEDRHLLHLMRPTEFGLPFGRGVA